PDASIEKIVLPTELCVRRSCGCFPRRAAAKPRSRPPSSGMEDTLIARRDVIVADLSRAARGAFGAAGNGWEARLVQAFLSELATGHAAALVVPQIPAGVAGVGPA